MQGLDLQEALDHQDEHVEKERGDGRDHIDRAPCAGKLVAVEGEARNREPLWSALADGTISRVIPLTFGQKYSITYWYRGPGIAGWWRGASHGDR